MYPSRQDRSGENPALNRPGENPALNRSREIPALNRTGENPALNGLKKFPHRPGEFPAALASIAQWTGVVTCQHSC